MEPVIPDINFKKLSEQMSEMSGMGGNTTIDETQINDQAYQQIVGFLKTDKLNQFRGLITAEERIKFIYKNEGYWPILQVIFTIKAIPYEEIPGFLNAMQID